MKLFYFLQAIGIVERQVVPLPKKPTRTKMQPSPSLHNVAGESFVISESNDQIEWTNAKSKLSKVSKLGRIKTMTPFDNNQIFLHNLNAGPKDIKLKVNKYAAIKFQWGSGLSSAKISANLGTGYSKRLVDTYVAAINRGALEQNPSPTV